MIFYLFSCGWYVTVKYYINYVCKIYKCVWGCMMVEVYWRVEGDNQILVELLFPTSTREIILLIFKQFVFLLKMFSK